MVACGCHCTHTLPFNGEEFFLYNENSYTFSKSSLGLTHRTVNLCSLSFAKSFELPSKLCPLVNPKILGTISLCSHAWKRSYSLFGTFCLHSFCIYSSNRQVLTIQYIFQTIVFFLQLTNGSNIHTLSITCEQSTSLGSLDFRVAKLISEHELFQCKNRLTLMLANSYPLIKWSQIPSQQRLGGTTFAISAVHILRTLLPLCLFIAFWFKTRVGVFPAASSASK